METNRPVSTFIAILVAGLIGTVVAAYIFFSTHR